MQNQKSQSKTPDELENRKAYLIQIERDIEAVTLAGADRLRVIQGEIDAAEKEKARLMKLNIGLEQQVRETRELLAQLENWLV